MEKFSLWRMACVVGAFCAAAAIASPAQTFSTVYSFCSQPYCVDGEYPLGQLVQGSDGNFYGTTYTSGSGGYGTIYKVTSQGALTVLHGFTGLEDGAQPYAGAIQARDGNFYGVTTIGGNTPSGCGTVYKIAPGGTFTWLHRFAGSPNDGCTPWPPLVQASDGNFYGTTYGGGTIGLGTVFKITPSGTLTILHNFAGQSDGGIPLGGLIQGSDGNLYGEATTNGSFGYGTIFKITLSGTLAPVHSFNGADGSTPDGGLVLGSDGNFYGTTTSGGAQNYGTVFKMTPSGTLTTLYSFCSQPGCTDGNSPDAGLVQGSDGNFYGTTYLGGPYNQGVTYGTVFAITPSGSLTTLYNFCSQANCTDGAFPYAGLTKAADGSFYGVTKEGGVNNAGTVFRLAMNYGTLTVSTIGDGTVTSTDGYINCPGTCSHIYPENAPVTLNASAAGGWTFAGWSGACAGTGSCNLTMTHNQSVGATFSQLSYSLTVSTNGNGSITSTDGFINCPGTCSHIYLSNTLVTLVSNPALGWSLNTWGGACSGNGSSCNVTMTGNESVSAAFTQNSYTLTVSISGDGTVTSTDGFINCPGACSHTYLSLTPVTLNASPAHDWSFSGWSGSCSGVGPCSLTMLGNYGVSAYFIQPGSGLRFSAVTPCRLVDTRPQNGGGGPIQGGAFQTFNLPQLSQTKNCGDLSTAAAYSLNVTLVPVNNQPVAYLTIWPAGLAQPLISTMNSLDGRIKAVAAIVPGGVSQSVSIYVTNTTNVVMDIDGYFAPSTSSTLEFYPLTPCRVLDTRKADDPLGGPYLQTNEERDFPVLESNCQIPNTAQAYSLNFTVVPYNGEPLGYLTVWGQGGPKPAVSTLNNLTATIVANAAIVPAGTGGGIAVYPSGNTQLVADINGYFAPAGNGGLSLYPAAPCRVIDTRKGNGAFSGELTVDVVDSVCAPPATAQAYVFNATVVPVGPLGYLTLWPDSENQPMVSTLNAIDAAITSNMAIVPNVDGKTDAFASGTTQLILDISSYFAP